jgi:hypothetical protein
MMTESYRREHRMNEEKLIESVVKSWVGWNEDTQYVNQQYISGEINKTEVQAMLKLALGAYLSKTMKPQIDYLKTIFVEK